MKCKKCGQNNETKDKYCNDCRNKSAHHKKKISALGIIFTICLVCFGAYTLHQEYGLGMSLDQKQAVINEVLKSKDYDRAKTLAERFYNENNEDEKHKKLIVNKTINICKITNTGSMEEAMAYYGSLKSSMPVIQNTSFQYTNDDTCLATCTVTNNTDQDISMVKIKVRFLDRDGQELDNKLINSNDSVIKAGETQQLSITSSKPGVTKVDATLLEYK